MSITKPPITPACVEVLSCVLAETGRGQPSTHGKLVKQLGKGKRAVSESLRRLEEEGWIKRPPFRAGCVREIKLAKLRAVVARAVGGTCRRNRR
jgi:DNA-binding GntR family transcriptional regulator